MTTDAEPRRNGALMPAEMADAWAAVYLDVAEKIEAEESTAEPSATTRPGDEGYQPDG